LLVTAAKDEAVAPERRHDDGSLRIAIQQFEDGLLIQVAAGQLTIDDV
jgi:hypothetical protein